MNTLKISLFIVLNFFALFENVSAYVHKPVTKITTNENGVTSCSTHYAIISDKKISFGLFPTKLTAKTEVSDHLLVFILNPEDEFTRESIINVDIDGTKMSFLFDPEIIDGNNFSAPINKSVRVISMDKTLLLKILHASNIKYELNIHSVQEATNKKITGIINNKSDTFFNTFINECTVI
jgi:hypothetical protein